MTRRVGITPWRALVTAAIFVALGGCIMPAQQNTQGHKAQTLRSTTPWSPGELTLPPLPDDADSTREAEADAPAVVLLDERTVTHVINPTPYSAPPHTLVEVRRAMRLDHASAAEGAVVRIHLDADAQLVDVKAETRTADGRVLPVREAQAFELARYAEGRPDRALAFTFPYAEKGAVIRWAYRVRHDGLRPLDAYGVPQGLPVRRATYRFQSYDFVEIDSQRHGMAFTRLDGDGHQRTWRWQVQDLPHAPSHAGETPQPSGRASVRLAVRDVLGNGFVRNWSAILEPLLQRQFDRLPLLPAAWPEDAPAGDPLRRAVALVERDLADGVTPLAPEKDDPSALHRFRRGTAHDRAGLVYALLTRWQTGCRLLATNGRGATPISADFAMPIDDLHLLVECGRRIYDPTCSGCAVGRLSSAVRGRFAIALELDERERLHFDFRRLPAPAVPPVLRGYELEVTARGLVARQGAVVLHDVHADRVRRWLREHPLPPTEAADAVATEFLDGIEASRIEVSGHHEPSGPVRFTLSNVLVARGGFAHGAGWALVALERVFGEPVFDLARVEERSRPMTLHTDMGFENTLSLPPAEGWRVARHPVPTVIESRFGSYSLVRPAAQADAPAAEGEAEVARSDEAPLVLVEKLTVAPGVVEPGDWPTLRAFLEKVAAHRRTPTMLRRVP